MSTEVERIYTIPLGKVLLSPNNRRAMRAINMIREFARHHMKVDDIRIEENLSHKIWARGIKKPPRKIRVRMTKTDEGHILVSAYTSSDDTVKDDAKVEEISDIKATLDANTTTESTETISPSDTVTSPSKTTSPSKNVPSDKDDKIPKVPDTKDNAPKSKTRKQLTNKKE